MTSEQLKQMREVTGMSPEDFATEIGVTPAGYEQIESGEVPVREIHLNAARWALVLIACIDKRTAQNLPKEIKEVIKTAAANI